MPGPEDFLRSFVPRSPQIGDVFEDPSVEDLEALQQDLQTSMGNVRNTPWVPPRVEDFADYESIVESRALPRQVQDVIRSFENARATPSFQNPKAAIEAGRTYGQNPFRTKQNILSETIARMDEMPEFDRSQATQIASDVLSEAKADRFGSEYPRGLWRRASNYDSNESARAMIQGKRDFFSPDIVVKGKEGVFNVLNKAKENIGSAASNLIRYPDFIANPLGLRNPVVTPDSGIPAGSLLNAQAVEFVKNFSPDKRKTFTEYSSPFDAKVTVGNYPGTDEYSLSFKGPFDYGSKKQVLNEIRKREEQIKEYEKQAPTNAKERVEFDEYWRELNPPIDQLRNEVVKTREKLNNPLTSPSLNYLVGTALEDVPEGGILTAAPIGGERGARARWYAGVSNDALKTGKWIIPNSDQLPSDEEFRGARQGSGYTGTEMRQYNELNADSIRSTKVTPNTWLNYKGEQKEFDPSTLKDPLIRTIYNLPETEDVSSLRNNPLGLIQKARNVDYTKPVLTTDSPLYKLRGGIKSGLSVGAADLIPSRETIQDFYSGKPLQGLTRMAGDFAGGIPTALATGAAVSAAPALAPLAPGVGLGLASIRAANAADEVTRQQTGEGIISKLRQTLGTVPRTGYANPDFKTESQSTTPQVTTLSPQQRATMEQRQNRNELQKRVDLFKERFNPSRGEFGFSELMFGR